METNIYLECFGRTESQKRYWNEVFATEMNKRALSLCDYAIRAHYAVLIVIGACEDLDKAQLIANTMHACKREVIVVGIGKEALPQSIKPFADVLLYKENYEQTLIKEIVDCLQVE
ncbi:hypothetical protein C815_00331 [Firmicutes bacterium M10-2]|nr:hypothetical protein C815_00331 [Firmicutes bacterium M10-2]